MNAITPARRNATPQDARHIASMVTGLHFERVAFADSFIYAAGADRPILTAIKDMQETDDAFYFPSPALTPQMRADAAAFGGPLESETTQ